MNQPLHLEKTISVSASPSQVFAYIDDHTRFSSHMNQSSWMMLGTRMETRIDEGKGQKVGSHIRMSGKILGIPLFLDEVITRHEPPFRKTWETVGEPKLLVVGSYGMGIEITPDRDGSLLKVYIDYEFPPRRKWLGRIFGGTYAHWCVDQMANGVRRAFANQ